MQVLKIETDERTMDRVADRALEVGGSLPANYCVHIGDPLKRNYFTKWLDHIGVKYTLQDYEPEQIKRGHLVANHVNLVTWTKRGADC